MKRVCRFVLVGCLLGAGELTAARGWAQGRNLWLEADPAAKPGERALHLRAGEGFKAEEERPLQKERVSRFDLYADQARRRDLLATGQEGQTPVAKLPPEPSACLVVMDRRETTTGASDTEMGNRRAAEGGPDAAAGQRTRPAQGGAENRETVFRFLKALVPGQDPASTLPNTFYKRRVEQRLELLLQNNPGRLAPNRRLTVKVLFEGKPLAGVRVFAYRKEGVSTGGAGGTPAPTASPAAGNPASTGNNPWSVVTSPQGLAEFKLEQNGPWLVEAIHMRAGAERKANPGGGTETFESTYSFVAKDAPAGAGSNPGRTVSGDGK